MVRTQIQLTEEQHRRLKAEAYRRGVSISAVAREFVALGLERREPVGEPRHHQALLDLIGCGRDTAADVSVNHDKYLAEIYDESHR